MLASITPPIKDTMKKKLSIASSTVPIVDLALPLEAVGSSIHDACTKVGFFFVINHGVSTELCNSVLTLTRKFFMLSTEEKEKISIRNSISYRGYQRIGENITKGRADFHEGLDLYSESVRAMRADDSRLTNYGKNQWPNEALPELQPLIEEYVKEMSVVGKRLMQGCTLGLGLNDPEYFADYFSDPFWGLRLIHYPKPTVTPSIENVGCGEHCDYGTFTLILSEDVPNTLQIKTEDEWVFVEPLPGAFICNVGDMLSIWTNGIYRSTPHRVLQPSLSSNGRVSCPFFFEPSYDAIIKPIEALVQNSGRLPSFHSIKYGDHLLAKTSKNFAFNHNR